MESAINKIRDLHSKASASEQQKIQEQLRDLQTDLYTDWEVLFGLAMGVCKITSPSLKCVAKTPLASLLGPRANRLRS
jgi:hypothetical protein